MTGHEIDKNKVDYHGGKSPPGPQVSRDAHDRAAITIPMLSFHPPASTSKGADRRDYKNETPDGEEVPRSLRGCVCYVGPERDEPVHSEEEMNLNRHR